MAHANGHFVWHDLLTKDPKAAIAFYSEVVGWKTQPFTEGGKSDYAMWVGSQGPLGGVMKLQDQAAKMGATPNWMGHESVDATAALAKKLRALGGAPGLGRSPLGAEGRGRGGHRTCCARGAGRVALRRRVDDRRAEGRARPDARGRPHSGPPQAFILEAEELFSTAGRPERGSMMSAIVAASASAQTNQKPHATTLTRNG